MNKLEGLEMDAQALAIALEKLSNTEGKSFYTNKILVTGFALINARLQQIAYILLDRSSN